MSTPPGYRCSRCGEWHPDLPQAYGAEAPELWFLLSDAERKAATLTEERCVIENRFYFLLGCLAIPVIDGPGPFVWGVWVSLSVQNYRRTLDLWTDPARVVEPPYFGWLSTTLPGYPPTLNLKTMVHTRPVGERPWVEVEPGSHPLADEQQRGITRARVQEIAEIVQHGEQRSAEGAH